MNPHRCRPSIAFAAALLSVTLGCDADSTTQPSGLPVVSMDVGGKTYQLEVAADDASREHGLMERDVLPADHGMIFVFPDEEPRNFWMKHTRFPLDIVFADHAGRVVSVHTMKPYDLSDTPSDGPATFAIELNAGTAATVKPGDPLTIPPLPKAK